MSHRLYTFDWQVVSVDRSGQLDIDKNTNKTNVAVTLIWSQALLMNAVLSEQRNVVENWRPGIRDDSIHHSYDCVVDEWLWRQLQFPRPWRERMSLWFMPSRWDHLLQGVKLVRFVKSVIRQSSRGLKLLRFFNITTTWKSREKGTYFTAQIIFS